MYDFQLTSRRDRWSLEEKKLDILEKRPGDDDGEFGLASFGLRSTSCSS